MPASKESATEANLRTFALANCLFWYFQKKGWDDSDIRGVSGGLVETGESDPEAYARIAAAVRDWRPDIRTKNDLDVDLVKCFHLDQNHAVEAIIGEHARSPTPR